jgi:hypothetical protein
MKEIEIDGKRIIIFEDGSIRIAAKGMQLCLDSKDIALLYQKSKKALIKREIDCEDYCGEGSQHFPIYSTGNV